MVYSGIILVYNSCKSIAEGRIDVAVEKRRRVRLEVNGVVCGLITEESEDYMQSLAEEVGALMKEVQAASPFITRESAALTAALSYCDDLKKSGVKAVQLQERIDELEVEAELFQEEQAERDKNAPDASLMAALEKENAALQARIAALEGENRKLLEENQKIQEQSQKAQDEARRLLAELEEARKSLAEAPAPWQPKPGFKYKNPMRYDHTGDSAGLVSFFEKK